MVKVVETKAEFDEIMKCGKVVVVDFSADWCGPCKMIAPKFAAIAEENPDIVFIKVDVDQNADTASACSINCMPTFQIFVDGKRVEQLEGANENKLRELVAKYKGGNQSQKQL
ncbi:hypothetical protein ACF0H5_023670 [Mactra antiquata]